MSTPMSGPPIGVVPWNATDQSAITRPLMDGVELSWRVELTVELKVTLAQPAIAMAPNSRARLGDHLPGRGWRQA
jgi:hypothetical protein